MADSYVEALLHERKNMVAAKRPDRVRAINAELRRLGIGVTDDKPETATETAPEKAVRPRGRPRKAR